MCRVRSVSREGLLRWNVRMRESVCVYVCVVLQRASSPRQDVQYMYLLCVCVCGVGLCDEIWRNVQLHLYSTST